MSYSLQNYTTYSILSGLMSPKQWVQEAVNLGYSALGICDKSTMGGMLDFQDECLAAGIKPIFGIELPMARELVREKHAKGVRSFDGNVLLYVKNEVGYKNLVTLNNISQSREGKNPNFFHIARIDYDSMTQHREGLICVIPECDGYGTFVDENGQLNVTLIMELKDLFGDDLYIGLEETQSGNQSQVFRQMVQALNLKVVPTLNAHYPKEEQYYLQKIARAIDKQRAVGNNFDRNVDGCFLQPMELNPMLDEILNKVDFLIPTGEVHMPEPILRNSTVQEDLLERIGVGFKQKLNPKAGFDRLTSLDELDQWADGYPYEHIKRGEEPSALRPLTEYVEQLKYEWNIIENLGFTSYFHIVDDVCYNADINQWARGYGRGSAAGSQVSYLLNITEIDSIRHGLFFERFLNPDRNDLPDIDLDFGKDARVSIVDWVANRYGKDRVVFIGAYDRLKVSSTVKYVAKIMGYSIPSDSGERVQYDDRVVNSLFTKSDKNIPETVRGRAELEYMVQEYEEIAAFYESHTQWFESHIFPLLETITAQTVHAAGVLVLPDKYESLMPIWSHSKKELAITQFRDKYCEKLGYPKFDFLTVQAIDVISNARKLILKRRDPNFPNWGEVSLSDPKAIEVFSKIQTQGIFQFGSRAQQQFFKDLEPKLFDHLVAAVALVRPGPINMGTHTAYAKAANNQIPVVYDHPDLEQYLGDTYGFIVYQEQMMSIAKGIAGFTGSEADHLRKACGKKKPEEMKKWGGKFKEQATANGYSQELVDKLWDNIVSFAEYSFNKAHSVAYTAISYYEGYIKGHYPLEFWCAVMNAAKKSNGKGKDSIHSLKGTIERMGIEFVFPSVNGFSIEFAPAGDNKIYWPLSVLQGFGPSKVEYLESLDIEKFSSLEHMLETVNPSMIGKTAVENMIRAGFFTPIEPQWITARKYYLWRAAQADEKLKTPKGVEHHFERENIPEDMFSEDPIQWAMSRNKAFGSTMESWKDVAPFHNKVQRYTKTRYEKIQQGGKCFVGGRVDTIRYKKSKKGEWFFTMNLHDGDEKYVVRGWGDYWESRELDKRNVRPEKGDLVELIGFKDIWAPEPGKEIHTLMMNTPDQYIRIINRQYNI